MPGRKLGKALPQLEIQRIGMSIGYASIKRRVNSA